MGDSINWSAQKRIDEDIRENKELYKALEDNKMSEESNTNTQREELEELIDRWRDAAEYASELGYWNEADSVGCCADELEEVLDND